MVVRFPSFGALCIALFWVSCQSPILPLNDGASSPNFTWAVQYGAANQDFSTALSLASDGSIYMTGTEQAYISDISTFTSGWRNATFIAQYSANGSPRWVQRIVNRKIESNSQLTTSTTIGRGVATDTENNVYVIGEFRDTVNAENVQLASAGGSDVFIAKYSSGGSLQWLKRIGGKRDDVGYGIAVGTGGRIFVTGYFSDSVRFGGALYVSNNSSKDIFLAALSSNGDVVWVQSAGGSMNDEGHRILIDKQDNIYLTGTFNGVAVFPLGGEVFTSAQNHPFLARYRSDAALAWVREIGGVANDLLPVSPTLDSDGNIIFAGNFRLYAMFDTVRLSTDSQNQGAWRSAYIAKFTPENKVLWVKQYQNSGLVLNTSATDAQGNIYVGGWYDKSVDVGGLKLGSANNEQQKIVILQYAANGDLRSTVRSGDVAGGEAICSRIAVRQSGEIIGIGSFYYTAVLGSTILNTRSSGSDEDVLLFHISLNR